MGNRVPIAFLYRIFCLQRPGFQRLAPAVWLQRSPARPLARSPARPLARSPARPLARSPARPLAGRHMVHMAHMLAIVDMGGEGYWLGTKF